MGRVFACSPKNRPNCNEFGCSSANPHDKIPHTTVHSQRQPKGHAPLIDPSPNMGGTAPLHRGPQRGRQTPGRRKPCRPRVSPIP